MRLPISWLEAFTGPLPAMGEVESRLLAAGVEVEAVADLGAGVRGPRIVRVCAAEPLQGTERLARVAVDDGTCTREVVSGAPGIQVGGRYVWAPAGSELPRGVRVEDLRIRGVLSAGMLLSAEEIGLEVDSGELLLLPDDAPLGEDAAAYLGLPQRVLTLAITPNLAYLTSVRAMAGFWQALTGGPPIPSGAGLSALPRASIPVDIAVPELCPIYVAGQVHGVGGAMTPFELRWRLALVGQRSHSLAVDLTNYILWEEGQPLHAFDLDAIQGGIQVRRARAGETLVTLDGQVRGLEPDDLVIADELGPVAVAGVMGGERTQVRAGTRRILLESASFHAPSVRRTRRRLQIPSEAAQRFERGVDPALAPRALERALALGQELGLGRAVGLSRAGEVPASRTLELRPQRIAALLGVDLGPEEIAAGLGAMGLEVTGSTVTVPPGRADVEGDADLAEEVLRWVGMDRVPGRLPHGPITLGTVPPRVRAEATARRALLGMGFDECLSYSLVGPEDLERARHPGPAVRVRNPLAEEASLLRPGLFAGLMRAAAYNLAHEATGVRLFETGTVFWPAGQGVGEGKRAAFLVLGSPLEPGPPPRALAAKGVMVALLDALGLAAGQWERGDQPGLHPTRQARRVGAGPDAWFGEVHPGVLEAWELKGPAAYGEIDLEPLGAARDPGPWRAMPPRYPAAKRDVALIVGREVTFAAVAAAIRAAAGPDLESLRLFDRYTGPPVPEGKVSLAVALVFRRSDRTLSDPEVDRAVADIWARLERELGAELRR